MWDEKPGRNSLEGPVEMTSRGFGYVANNLCGGPRHHFHWLKEWVYPRYKVGIQDLV